jgi:hypothetical protein
MAWDDIDHLFSMLGWRINATYISSASHGLWAAPTLLELQMIDYILKQCRGNS